MSQYAEYYIRPIFKKQEQTELEKSGEIQKLAHLPTRAALNDQTSSLNQDDLVKLVSIHSVLQHFYLCILAVLLTI